MNNKLINPDTLRTLPTIDALVVLGQAINNLTSMIQTGPVWENRVEAQRQVEEVYTSLPVSVVAEMVEQDYTNTMQEIGLEAIQ